MVTHEQHDSTVAVLGLGLLGTALAERLLSAGLDVRVWNRTAHKAAPLLKRGAQWSEHPLAEADRVVICLFTTETVAHVLDYFATDLRPGQLLVDTTTGNPDETAALGARLERRGVGYLECPIAASSEQTRQGQAVAIVAGPDEVYAAAAGILEAIAAKSFFVGAWGNAAKMKLVNNLILGLNRAALAEGLAFAEAIGLQPANALAVVREGSAYSVVMDVKGQKMVQHDFSPQARLAQHRKDVRLILDQGLRSGIELPFSQIHSRLLAELDEAGLGDLDNSAIIRAYQR
jgi:3-hydroxyisobutyrate dehydrogenase-like beta-hydroxyacid dehydrogenase